jgi:signal transduction histidine kinase
LAIIGSVLGLARWWSGFPRLIPEFPELPSMVGNSALMGILLGASLLLLGARVPSRGLELARKILAGIAAAIAAVTHAEYVLGMDLTIDYVIAPAERRLSGEHPGRPSPQSATAFLFVAVALLNVRAPRAFRRSLAGVLATVSGLIALAVLLGYLFGAAALYGPLSQMRNAGMAIPTVIVTLVLSFGILAFRIDDGGVLSILTKEDSGGATARYFVVWLLGLAPVTGVIAIGARLGIYSAPFASALVVTCGILAVSAFTFRVSWRLSRMDAERRRAELENARLYAEAQRAVQIRDDVVGIVAHDLRNPLGSVLAQAGLLRRLGIEPGTREQKAVESIERAVKRMNRLVQDLLDVTRMEAGRLSVEPTRVTVRELVDRVVESQGPLAASASLALRVEVAREPLEIWADRDRIQQIFENLIGNAIKFTSPGGTIVVGVSPGEGEVRFQVADTGSGIASDDLPHVFERFWQVRRPGRHGAGLGLPIAKGIVESHNGRIWVESTPAVGTTFFFTIPSSPRAEDPLVSPAS